MGTPALNDPDPSSYKQVDEPDLARRAASGDRRAFAALYDRHVDAVYRYAYFRLRVDAEAEDVTSEVFHRALVAMPRFEPRRPFLAFLYTIARNVITDRMRRERPQASFEDALAHPRNAPRPAFRAELRSALLAAPVSFEAPRASRLGWSRVPALRPAVAAILVLALLATAGGVAAASSLPGDSAYGLKRAAEEVQVTLASDDVVRLDTLVMQADRRLA